MIYSHAGWSFSIPLQAITGCCRASPLNYRYYKLFDVGLRPCKRLLYKIGCHFYVSQR